MSYRDDHNFGSNISNTTEVHWGSWKYWGQHNTWIQKTRTYRDWPASTVPAGNGSYFRSTAYEAFFFTSSSSAYSYEWDWPGKNRHMRTSGDSGSTSWPVPGDLMTWGCRTAMPYTPSIPSKIISHLESGALAAIKNGDLDLGQTLGEMKETVGFIADLLLRLMQAVRFARKGDGRSASAVLGISPKDYDADAISSAYVAYQYGFKPLMNDIYGALNVIRNGVIPNAKPKVQFSKEDENFGPPGFSAGVSGSFDATFKRGAEIGIMYEVTNQTLYDLDRYGILDPLSLAWELIPLSFVVDWVIPVGAFLDSMTKPFGLRFLDGYLTTYVEKSGSMQATPEWHGNVIGSVPTVKFRGHSSNRAPYWTWPIPDLYLDFEINVPQALSVVALTKLRG